MHCKKCNSKNIQELTNGNLLCFECGTCKKCLKKIQNNNWYIVFNDIYCDLECYYRDKNIPSYEKDDE